MDNSPRTGRPSRTERDIELVRAIVQTVREISDITGICANVVYRTITQYLGMWRVSARWVPLRLNDEQTEKKESAFQVQYKIKYFLLN